MSTTTRKYPAMRPCFVPSGVFLGGGAGAGRVSTDWLAVKGGADPGGRNAP